MTRPPGAAASVDYQTITVSPTGDVRRLVLNRPDRHNAQNPRMWREIVQAVGRLADDDQVRVLVVEGAGKSFSSGLDQRELGPGGFLRRVADLPHPDTGQPDAALAALAEAQAAFLALRHAPFPVVAAVRGVALGAGLELALACDLRIVTSPARLAVAEVRHGVVPDLGATAFLPRLIGVERALDLILTGREFDGDEAVRLGLALKSVPPEDLDDAVGEYTAVLASATRQVLAHAKAATYETDEAASLRRAAVGMADCLRTAFPRGHT